jgi:hypothetical protein
MPDTKYKKYNILSKMFVGNGIMALVGSGI